MLFNSLAFFAFFPIVTALYFILPHRWRWVWLLMASVYFYLAGPIPIYILILVFTILVDYAAGLLIENAQGSARRFWLIASVFANVGALVLFKYVHFFTDHLGLSPMVRNWLLAEVNNATQWSATIFGVPSAIFTDLLLPVGLSFHTFQSLSYTFEVYYRRQNAERHLGIFALYVLFYPQLVAGPIERPQNLLPQFRTFHPFDYGRITDGLRQMAWGFVKKMIIADRLAVLVNTVYAHPTQHQGLSLALATFFFTWQIYCDFSGYSDIAIGAARVMGFKLMTNFRFPYLATSISDFWSRWHISLSTWFRDYLYIPLGGNRVAAGRWLANVFIVFVVSGFWHGANWTFLIWGALHGLYSIVAIVFARINARISEHLARFKPVSTSATYTHAARVFSWLITFFCVSVAWVFFRANSVSDAIYVVQNMFVNWSAVLTQAGRQAIWSAVGQPNEIAIAFMLIALLWCIEALQTRLNWGQWLKRQPVWLRWGVYYACVVGILLLGRIGAEQFIYFQF
jgi:D-alanyl-lipoteichoic acid acyltransferase DltB (MBOAT superfamily)